jgi:hypothetical protein
MADQGIKPDRITKPIQLLAAWLTGLVLIDGAFLTAAASLTRPDWGSGVLVVAAVVNVPLFIAALFSSPNSIPARDAGGHVLLAVS